MSVSGGYIILPEEVEILRELESIGHGEVTNSYFIQVIKYLKSSYVHVRSKCLQVIGGCIDPSTQVPGGRSTVFELVQWYSNDRDARVRETILCIYVHWLERKVVVPDISVLCEMVENGVNDCEDEVIITALKLAIQLGKTWPTMTVSRGKMPLVDKSFIHVACAMNHPSSSVRKVAAKLLCGLEGVSEYLLLETLEKTVMKDRVIHKSAFDKTNEINKLFWIDDRSNFAQRSLDTVVTPEDALAIGGINGTVISGLEDDLYEIRLETVTSVGRLSIMSNKFATACQDLLVDMLTDDIEIVRSAAVTNLSLASGIKHNMALRSDQLDIVLSVLSEKSGNMRRSIHILLGNCKLASTNAMMQLLAGLLKNLSQYELDRDSIWKCSANIGRNHPEFVQMNLSSLLKLHPYLMVKQSLRSDPEYITVLLMVINAGRKLRSIKANFPTHVMEHEVYIKELVPELIYGGNDDLEEPRCKQAKYDCNDIVQNAVVSRQDLYNCLLTTIGMIYKMFSGDNVQTFNNNVLRQLLQDLRQISKLYVETKGLCLWMRDLVNLTRLSQYRPMTLTSLSEGRYLCFKMIHAYTGISEDDCDLLKRFIGSINKKIDCIQSQDFLPTRETKEILSTCPPLSILMPLSVFKNIDQINKDIHPMFSLVQVTAKQLYPTTHETEKTALKFCAGMGLSLQVRAEFSGLDIIRYQDVQGQLVVKTPVVVVINRPDGMVFRWQPPDHCWSSTDQRGESLSSPKTLFLDTEVPVSFNEWSEAGLVHLGLAVLLQDIDTTWKLTEPIGVKVYPMAANKSY